MPKMSNSAIETLKSTLRSMPIRWKIKAIWGMIIAGNNNKKRYALMHEIASRRQFTIPREQIPWNPSVDSSLCDGCGICVAFCPKDVFETHNGSGKSVVVRPVECVFLCSGCVSKCPQGAISFPDRKDFYQFVHYD